MMQPKTRKFVKNALIAVPGVMAAGIFGTKAVHSIFHSSALESLVSPLVELGGGLVVFTPLHIHDNPDLYRDQRGHLRWRPLLADLGKMLGGVWVLDYAYMPVRIGLQYYFTRKGVDPGAATFLAQGICIPAYLAIYLAYVKGTGMLREGPSQD